MKLSILGLKVFFAITALLTVSLTYNNCATSKFESQSFLEINQASQLPDGQGRQFVCTGNFPNNSILCHQDDIGLFQSDSRQLVSRCTNQRKCEFVCDVGFNLVNGSCQPPAVLSCSSSVPCSNGVNCSLQIGSPTAIQQQWALNTADCGYTCINGYSGSTCQIAPGNTYFCQGATPGNASLCPGDDLNLTQNTNRILSLGCTSDRRCEYVCNSGFFSEDGICKPNRVCQGSVPNNADLCANDEINLTVDTQRAVFNSCSSDRKCEYTCRSGYTNISGSCQQNQESFQCQGTAPANSDLCANDEQGLTASLNRILINQNTQCTARKCEYFCKTGFSNLNNGGVCVANVSCTGLDPVNAQLCPGDDTGLNANTPKTLLPQSQSCSSSNKCEFTCRSDLGYVNQGGICVQPTTFSCTGSTPANSVMCDGDDQNLTTNTAKSLRAAGQTCTSAKCEYLCDAANGYINVNGVCTRVTPSCATPVPCVNTVNCNIVTGTPPSPSVPWEKGSRNHCSFTCTEDYEGETCERGRIPVNVACANAEKDLPLATHFSLALTPTPGFLVGASDDMILEEPNASTKQSTRRIYNYGLLPSHNNYIADNYEHIKISDTEYNSWAQGECVTSGLPIEFRKPKNASGVYDPAGFTNWSLAKLGLKSNRRSIQVLHPLILGKNLVTVILPPEWKPTDPPGKYPILATGVYDLANNLIHPNQISIQSVAKAYTQYQTPVIGIIWNGGGGIGSRTMQSSARASFNDIVQNVKNQFGGDPQRIFIFGGSRGGWTAISMTTNPENYPYRIVGAYAAVPPADIPLLAGLTGSTIPALFSAPEWSIGLLDTWKKNFRYPILNEMSGFTREEAHMYILGGTRSATQWDNELNLTSPRMMNKLYERQQQNVGPNNEKLPRIFLEIGSHDFIVPWIDQFKYRNALIEKGIAFESRTNYLAGHWADTVTTNAEYNADALARNMQRVASGDFYNIFSHGRHSQYMNHPTRGMVRIDNTTRFTAEIPRVISQNVNGHLIFTGVPGTHVRMTFVYTAPPPNNTPVTSDPPPIFTLDNKGTYTMDIGTLGLGTYEIKKFEILLPPHPNTLDWSRAKVVFDSAQPAKTFSTTVRTKRDDQNTLRVDVLDENLHINSDTSAAEIDNAIRTIYHGTDSNDATNLFKNTSYGICEE